MNTEPCTCFYIEVGNKINNSVYKSPYHLFRITYQINTLFVPFRQFLDLKFRFQEKAYRCLFKNSVQGSDEIQILKAIYYHSVCSKNDSERSLVYLLILKFKKFT